MAATVIQLLDENDEYSEAVTINSGFKHFSIWRDYFSKNAKVLYLCVGVNTHSIIIDYIFPTPGLETGSRAPICSILQYAGNPR